MAETPQGSAARLADLINDVISKCIEQEEDSEGNYHDYVSYRAGTLVLDALREAGALRDGI